MPLADDRIRDGANCASEQLQLPANSYGHVLSALLVKAYRGPDFPTRLRLLDWLRRATGNKRIIAPLRAGGWVAVDPRDLIQRQLLHSGVYEAEISDLLCRELKVGDQFVDIGANVGCFSMQAQAQGAEVVAFEPDPLSAAVWRLNCRINDAEQRMKLLEVGLGRGTELLPFYRTGVGNTGRSGFLTDDSIDTFLVSVRALDELYAELGLRRDAIWKIDVEGFEAEVLEGAMQCLAKAPPRLIVFEAGEQANDPRAYSYLQQAGFRIEHLPRYSGERESKENYLARRIQR